MKKILIIILSIMYFIAGYCQTDPNFQPAGGIVIPSFLGGDYDDVTIYTPTNVSVEAYKLKSSGYELSATTKQSILAYCLNYYNNRIEFLGDATNTYNCHGYAWHMIKNEIGENENDTLCMDGNSNYWIVDYASYEEVSWQENAKVTFPNITDHSAIATDQQGTLISKWGNLPLFRHHINDCPYTPKTPLKYYWIKKPVISGLLDTMYSGDTCTFSETRFIANNILGIEYNWEILNNNLIQVGPNYSSKFTVQATSHIGKDTLCLHITTPSGQTNSDTIEIYLNPPVCPDPDDFTVYVEERYGDPVPGSPDGPFEVCDNTSYWICLYP